MELTAQYFVDRLTCLGYQATRDTDFALIAAHLTIPIKRTEISFFFAAIFQSHLIAVVIFGDCDPLKWIFHMQIRVNST